MSCEEVPFSRAILKGENILLTVQVSGGGFSLWSSPGSGSLPTDLDQGTTLLVTATLKFAETARLDGKLSVRGMNALQGPCLAFNRDAFVAASAELHFANCHNIVQPKDRRSVSDIDWDFDLMQISASDAEAAEVDGGAMKVRGSLMVMGTLIIRDCRTKDGNGGSLGSNYGSLSPVIDDGRPQKVDLWVCYVEL